MHVSHHSSPMVTETVIEKPEHLFFCEHPALSCIRRSCMHILDLTAPVPVGKEADVKKNHF